jgi:hypothetical protein
MDREKLIKERAYSLWETEGNPDGRHEDHWVQAEQEIDGANTGSSLATDVPNPSETNAETILLPDQSADQVGDVPPARTGPAENSGDPVESVGKDNPIHHKGRIPLDPLAK